VPVIINKSSNSIKNNNNENIIKNNNIDNIIKSNSLNNSTIKKDNQNIIEIGQKEIKNEIIIPQQNEINDIQVDNKIVIDEKKRSHT